MVKNDVIFRYSLMASKLSHQVTKSHYESSVIYSYYLTVVIT